tara:strand:- start:578 stop:997 length:420 start_codon:yes stop_codon:yes gene_type:complete
LLSLALDVIAVVFVDVPDVISAYTHPDDNPLVLEPPEESASPPAVRVKDEFEYENGSPAPPSCETMQINTPSWAAVTAGAVIEVPVDTIAEEPTALMGLEVFTLDIIVVQATWARLLRSLVAYISTAELSVPSNSRQNI